MTYFPDTRTDDFYNERYLNDADKEYIRGFDFVMDDLIPCVFANLDVLDLDVDGEDFDLGRILENHPAIAERFESEIRAYLERERDVMITSMIDHMDDDEYEKIKESVDKERYELGEEEEQED